MLISTVDSYTKASVLVNVIENELQAQLNPDQYLIATCYILLSQQHQILKDIGASMLQQLGKSLNINVNYMCIWLILFLGLSVPTDANDGQQHSEIGENNPSVPTDQPSGGRHCFLGNNKTILCMYMYFNFKHY